MKTLHLHQLVLLLAVVLAISITGSLVMAAPSSSPDKKKKTTEASAKKSSSSDKKTDKTADKASSSTSKPPTPATHTVKKDLFEIKVELSGVFDAIQTSPIRLAPEVWSSMSVLEAIPHGSEVKKGDVILTMETEKLEKAIHKAELARPLSELGLKLAELELIEMEKSTPLSLASQERSMRQAEEDLAYFEKTDRVHREKSAEQMLKQSTHSLDYAREELDQLQKMYAADDLTEETEEIIVTRAKNSVASAQFRLESAKLSTARTLNTTLPREHQSLRDRVKSAQISWEKSSQALPQSLKQKRLEVEKMKRDQKEAAEQLANMKKDLASFSVKAPHDGVVYYGSSTRGKWTTATLVEKKLQPGGKPMPHEVLMTVVQSNPLQVLISIPENKLIQMKQGQTARIIPTATPDSPLKGNLSSMNRVPLTTGGFPGTVKIEEGTDGLYPGMSCKVVFDIYKKEAALSVPKKAIHKENGKSYVHLKNGKKQEVQTGKSNDNNIEILKGLKEGDEVKL